MADEDNAQDTGEGNAANENEEAVRKTSAESSNASSINTKLVYGLLALNTIVLVVVAAVVAMNYLKSSESVSLADIEESRKADTELDQEAQGEQFFISESFTVNLADSRGAHFAKVDVVIEVPRDTVQLEIQRMMPRIRDFIVVILSSRTRDQVESVSGKDFLREEIRNKINSHLTRGEVTDVYFTQFIVQ